MAQRNESLIVTWLISSLRSLHDETGNFNPTKEEEMANLWLEISKSWLLGETVIIGADWQPAEGEC